MAEQEEPRALRLVSDNTVVPLTLAGVTEKTLEKVLEHLQKNDKLFDYHVPAEWRNPAKEGLQQFLVGKYSQGNFEITGEAAVQRYLRLYDFVAFDGHSPGFEYKYYLKPGMKGVITEVNLSREYPIAVLWEPCAEFPQEQKLMHEGSELSLLPQGIFRKEKVSSKVELLSEAAPGRLLEPTKTLFEYAYYLPIGTSGIVTQINQSVKFPVSVVFGNSEGYIPHSSGGISCTYGALKLFRQNKIDIRKLMRELS